MKVRLREVMGRRKVGNRCGFEVEGLVKEAKRLLSEAVKVWLGGEEGGEEAL